VGDACRLCSLVLCLSIGAQHVERWSHSRIVSICFGSFVSNVLVQSLVTTRAQSFLRRMGGVKAASHFRKIALGACRAQPLAPVT
jgi:hypothetical protein